MSFGKIFISYRRSDSEGYAGRIYDRLDANFHGDQIFMDVADIEPGEDFVAVLETAVSSCDVVLVLIGKNWLDVRDAEGNRRLDNPNDFVRLEVAAALQRDIRVIPVLVHSASMPRSQDLPPDLAPLSRRNALTIRHSSFNIDVAKLLEAVKRCLASPDGQSPDGLQADAPPGSDRRFLDISLQADPNPAMLNSDVNWTATVVNRGSTTHSNLVMINDRTILIDDLTMTPGEIQWFSFEKQYPAVGADSESVRVLGLELSAEAAGSVQVHKPPEIQISLVPVVRKVSVGETLNWSVKVTNRGGTDLQQVIVSRQRTLLADPFTLNAGTNQIIQFQGTYSVAETVTEEVVVTAIIGSNEKLNFSAEAQVVVQAETAPAAQLEISQTKELLKIQKNFPLKLVEPFPLELICIPEGEFLMGSDDEIDPDSIAREQPLHTIKLPEYFISKHPITNQQYAVFLETVGYQQPPDWNSDLSGNLRGEHPVVNISWYDALTFCEWLSAQNDYHFRLPSEAEWEKAARGINGSQYPWGNIWDPEMANTIVNGIGGSSQVRQFSPQGDSPYGCTNMAGNVWEWTRSLWGENPTNPDFAYPYDPTDGREDLDAPNHILRVVRGGAWCHEPKRARCAYRGRYYPEIKLDRRGFRVVVTPRS